MDEDDDELDEKTFICIECGILCPEDEWNDGDICDDCMKVEDT